MVVENAQNKALGVRRTEKGNDDDPNSGGDSGIGSKSWAVGDQSLGVGGNLCPEQVIARIVGRAFFGGIVDQLLSDAYQQLENAEACIKWYEDQKAKTLKRIETLQKLQQLGQQDSNK
jgi:hypothetical protein